MDTQDTIVALGSAPGGAARAVIRLSGPSCTVVVRSVFSPSERVGISGVPMVEGAVHLPGVTAPLPTTLYTFVSPHSYTGQDMAELHVPGCPPLVELLIAELLRAGGRSARPGEFTMRAFLSGKMDLTRAEAVHAVIHAGGRTELRQALGQMAGGMARPMQELREDLLNLLADVEAGLDFADEDIQFVDASDMLLRLGRAMALVMQAGKQLDARALSGQTYRIVLAGRPNAGKSSLFNALTGTTALVSDIPGTTRDYLVQRFDLAGTTVELIDTPGRQEAINTIDTQAQSLGGTQQREADLLLLCVEAGQEMSAEEEEILDRSHPPAIPVATKCDLQSASQGWIPTSSHTATGVEALRTELIRRIREREEPALAPSMSRCRHHVTACLEHLRRAHRIVLEEDPQEILAMELRDALHQLGEMVGAVYTDDLLDRIFSRFCIGK